METRIDPERFVEMVQAIYRLFRVATFHDVDNEAVGRAIDTCRRAMRAFAQEGQGLTLLFARDTVIVNGQLLQAPPDVYELAMEFGRFLTASGRNSFFIGAEVADVELRTLLAFFRERRAGADAGALAHEPDARGFLTPNIRLRWIRDELLVGLEDPRLSAFERVMLTYALAARVIRRLLDEVPGPRPEIPSFFKRVARQLALVDYASRPRVLDVTVGQHDGRDPARVGVDSAIVATAMARRLTRDERVLARVALTAMTLDLGEERGRVTGVTDVDPSHPMSTAVMHLRSGRLRSDAIDRTAVAWEARSLLARSRASAVYQQRLYPSLEAFLVATARRFVEYLAAVSGEDALAIDRAVEHVREHADTDEGLICADLLVAALTLIPRGTPVRLGSGHAAVVVAAAARPSDFESPTVVIVLDPQGQPIQPVTADLATDPVARERYGGVDQVLTDPPELLVGVVERVPGGAIELAWRDRREAAIAQYRARRSGAPAAAPPPAAPAPSAAAAASPPAAGAAEALSLPSWSRGAEVEPAGGARSPASVVEPADVPVLHVPPPIGDAPLERPTSRSQALTPIEPVPALAAEPGIELVLPEATHDPPEPETRRSQARTPVGGAAVVPEAAVPVERRADAPAEASVAATSAAVDEVDAHAFDEAPNSFVRRALARRTTGAHAIARTDPDADDADTSDSAPPAFVRRVTGVHATTPEASTDGGGAPGGIVRRRRRASGSTAAFRTGSGVHVSVPARGDRVERTRVGSGAQPVVVDDAARARFRAAALKHRAETPDPDPVPAERPGPERAGDAAEVADAAHEADAGVERTTRQTGVRRVVSEDFDDVPDAGFETFDEKG